TSLLTTPVTEENFAWYFYIDPIEGAEGMASEAAMSAVPHAICLLKLPEDADAEQVQADIEEALNPHKWVCVEAEANEVAPQDVVEQALENCKALGQVAGQTERLDRARVRPLFLCDPGSVTGRCTAARRKPPPPFR